MIIFWSNLTTFESSIIFWGSWGRMEKCLEPKTEPPSGNLACPNPWNALYVLIEATMSSPTTVGDWGLERDSACAKGWATLS